MAASQLQLGYRTSSVAPHQLVLARGSRSRAGDAERGRPSWPRSWPGGARTSPAAPTPARCSPTRPATPRDASSRPPAPRASASGPPPCRPSTPTSSRPTTAGRADDVHALMREVQALVRATAGVELRPGDPPRRLPPEPSTRDRGLTWPRPPPTLSRPTPIDPRIQARRIEVQRGVGRRRLQRLVDVGLVLAVAAGFAIALRSPLLDVDAVRGRRGRAHAHRGGARAGRHPAGGAADGRRPAGRGRAGRRAALGGRGPPAPWHRRHGRMSRSPSAHRSPWSAKATRPCSSTARDGPSPGPPRRRRSRRRWSGSSAPDAPVAPGDYLPASAEDAVALAARLASTPGLGMELVLGRGGARSPRLGHRRPLRRRRPTSTPRSGRCAPCWTRWISPARP